MALLVPQLQGNETTPLITERPGEPCLVWNPTLSKTLPHDSSSSYDF